MVVRVVGQWKPGGGLSVFYGLAVVRQWSMVRWRSNDMWWSDNGRQRELIRRWEADGLWYNNARLIKKKMKLQLSLNGADEEFVKSMNRLDWISLPKSEKLILVVSEEIVLISMDSKLREREGGKGNPYPERGQIRKAIAKELYEAVSSALGGGSGGCGGSGGGGDSRRGGQGGGRDGVAGN
ncbi:hypothetical protein MA16_Dca009676 [Dendrobium catenatum]|uniref:Uncharacterized protein n=1 Tax=Dendrobium catenatum TaxID=906689 RepID=A0A2I0VSP5_9ASPA|nr:hypothetical protein MA16_Dca009676 [Dendrobium catenatum]